jgi:hypothetical protein
MDSQVGGLVATQVVIQDGNLAVPLVVLPGDPLEGLMVLGAMGMVVEDPIPMPT